MTRTRSAPLILVTVLPLLLAAANSCKTRESDATVKGDDGGADCQAYADGFNKALATGDFNGAMDLAAAVNQCTHASVFDYPAMSSVSTTTATLATVANDSDAAGNSNLALDDQNAITCSEPTLADPTGCAAIQTYYETLEVQVDKQVIGLGTSNSGLAARNKLNDVGSAFSNFEYQGMGRKPHPSYGTINRRTMLGMIGGAAKMMAAITVPHCEKTTNRCELRARASTDTITFNGVHWATGACYPTRDEWLNNTNFNWAVFPCADGLECQGYKANKVTGLSTLLNVFADVEYGSCVVVDNDKYQASYFNPHHTPSPETQQKQLQTAMDEQNAQNAAYDQSRTCGPMKEMLAKYLDNVNGSAASSGTNRGALGAVLLAKKPREYCQRYNAATMNTDDDFWKNPPVIKSCVEGISQALDDTRFLYNAANLDDCGIQDPQMLDYVQRGRKAWLRLNDLGGLIAQEDHDTSLPSP